MNVVDLRNVVKVYKGRIRALDGVDLQIRKGELFGLLGPNGAGKSTLVKVMMTVIRATRAEGTVMGQPVGSTAALERVGYLPEHSRFPLYLTGRQVLDFFGALCKVPRATRRVRADELLGLVGMRDWADKRVTQYSKGMRQRIGIAVALVNDPALVVLDEPTDGVDPVGRRDIREMLLRLRNDGRSVMINSHLLGEVEMVADRVAIMSRGKVLAQGTIDELTRDSHRYEVVAMGAPYEMETQWGTVRCQIVETPDGTLPELEQTGPARLFSLPTTDPALVQPVIDALRAQGAVVLRVMRHRETLEDLFVRSVVDERGGYVPGARVPGVSGASAPPISRQTGGRP